jgi:hypothetical protein
MPCFSILFIIFDMKNPLIFSITTSLLLGFLMLSLSFARLLQMCYKLNYILVSIQQLSTNPKTNLKFNNAQTNLTSFQTFEMGIEK